MATYIAALKWIPLPHPFTAVHHPTLHAHHSLGPPRRSRCIDHIGQMIRAQPLFFSPRILLPPPAQQFRVRIQTQFLHPYSLQPSFHPAVGQHQRWPAVSDHVLQPFPRITRIQRHIRPSRFHDSHDPDHHLQRPLHTQPHHRVRPHSLSSQVMPHPVGSPVQFPVTQLLSPVNQRH